MVLIQAESIDLVNKGRKYTGRKQVICRLMQLISSLDGKLVLQSAASLRVFGSNLMFDHLLKIRAVLNSFNIKRILGAAHRLFVHRLFELCNK